MPLPQIGASVSLTWSLQAALAAGIAVAGAGVAVMFRRPAMHALAASFAIITMASALIWAGLTAAEMGVPSSITTMILALSPALVPVLGFFFYRQVIRLLAGQATEAMPAMVPMLTAVAVAVMVCGIAGALSESSRPGRPLAIALIGTIGAITASIVLATLSARARRQVPARAWAFNLLQVSFILLASRSALSIFVAVSATMSGEAPSFSVPNTVSQAFLMVAAAVLQLAAVLDEERTHSLQQSDQLRQAELAVAGSQRLESLGRMAGAVAHDFNNVLTAISVSAQSALAAPAASQDEALREVEASALRGKALTEQLLAFARAEQSKVTRFDARAQVEKLRSFLERVAGRRNTLEVELASALQLIDMDATQFDQVIINLVLNARDSMPTGGPIVVRIGGGDDASKTASVHITVEDSGDGIAADVLPHIFEPFYSTKGPGRGTGLGLAICDRIVRSAGGSIAVQSAPGKGTRFDVRIPRATEV